MFGKNLSRFTRYLAIAAFTGGLTIGSASATTHAVGNLTALGTFSGGVSLPAGAFSDSWTFTLSGGPNTFVGLFSSVFTPMTGFLSPLTISLGGPGGPFPWGVATSVGPFGYQYSIFGGTLAPGAYHLDISGTATHPSSYSLDLTAAIPEPGQWLMLFAGIALLGVIVRRRARG